MTKIIESGRCGNNIFYSLNEEGTLTISGSGEMYNYEYMNHYYISPFYSNKNIKKVIIFEGITSIGKAVFFNCSALISVSMPQSIKAIKNSAFRTCTAITSISIPDSVIEIEEGAFYNCQSLNSIRISSSITTIKYQTFAYCKSLKSIIIPEKVNFIGEKTFDGCSSLIEITLLNIIPPNSNNIWGWTQQYKNCIIKVYKNSISNYKNHPDFHYYNIEQIEPIIQSTLPKIIESSKCGENCYFQLSNFGTLTVYGNGPMKSIVYSFDRTKIKNIIINHGITSINNFGNCSSLTSITIPNSVTSIDENAFRECSSLSSIILPDSVISIGERAFSGSSISSIKLSNNITSIENYTFSNCKALKSINIPDSVVSIGNGAFLHCSSLTSIIIPNSVTSIGEYAFGECSAPISKFTISCFTKNIGQNAFYNIRAIGTSPEINIFAKNITDYCHSNIHKILHKTFGINRNTRLIINGEEVINLVIPKTVKSLDSFIFSNCKNIKSITISDGVISIGDFAFGICTALTSIVIPSSVIEIGNAILANCISIHTITCMNMIPPKIKGEFINTNIGEFCTLKVPKGSKYMYMNHEKWKRFKNIIEE